MIVNEQMIIHLESRIFYQNMSLKIKEIIKAAKIRMKGMKAPRNALKRYSLEPNKFTLELLKKQS